MKIREGYVYILIHPIQPGYVKIGQTSLSPEERAKEITRKAGTGLVGAHIVAYEELVRDSITIEKIIHKRLKNYRVDDNREFFFLPLKEAIKIVTSTIQDVKNQSELEFDIDDPLIWWSNLELPWKLVFKSHIPSSKNPTEDELMEGLFTIINYCRDNKTRRLVTQFLENKNHRSLLSKWYLNLTSSQQKNIKDYIPLLLEINDIEQILNLETVNCSGNLLIRELIPLRQLKNLRKIDCSNTSVSNLEPLKGLEQLESLSINHLTLSSLKPLYHLSKLKSLTAYSATIKSDSFPNLKQHLPNCEILENPFK